MNRQICPKRITTIMHLFPIIDTYYPEKVVPMKTAQPPSFSFGARTKLAKLDSGPSPNVYTLPSMIGTNTVSKTSSAAFSMTGRSKIGSFHQDLKKVIVVITCHN